MKSWTSRLSTHLLPPLHPLRTVSLSSLEKCSWLRWRVVIIKFFSPNVCSTVHDVSRISLPDSLLPPFFPFHSFFTFVLCSFILLPVLPPFLSSFAPSSHPSSIPAHLLSAASLSNRSDLTGFDLTTTCYKGFWCAIGLHLTRTPPSKLDYGRSEKII